MALVFRSRFFRGLVLFTLIAAAILVGGNGLLLVVKGFTKHVSATSSGIQILLGLIRLVLSPVVFIAGIVFWNSSIGREQDE